MLLGFAACDVSIDDAEEGHMSETFDLDEALEYISSIEPETISVRDTGLLAPAKNSENGLYGFININGEWKVEPKYMATVPYEEGVGLILNMYSGYEYINGEGKIVYNNFSGSQIGESDHFSEGLVAVSVSNHSLQKYFYADANFKPVITASRVPVVPGRWYGNTWALGLATPFKNGLAVVMRQRNVDTNDGLGPESAYVINSWGDVVATLPAGWDADPSGVDENGNVIVMNMGRMFGLCKSDGTILFECKYRFLKHCEGPLYLACNDKGFWGYVDENGNAVIPFQYQKALPFSEGLAAVYDGKFWGFIDETGALVIESVFDDVAALKPSNIDVSGNKGAFCEERAAVKKNGYWIIIDKSEYPYICLTEEKCEGIDGCPFIGIRNGYVIYKQNVDGNILCGVMTVSGKKVIEPSFAHIDIFN